MLIQYSNAEIWKTGNVYTIVNKNTGMKHENCLVNYFETYDLALKYMNSEDDDVGEFKVKCGNCHDFSYLKDWEVASYNEHEVICPICAGEFKDVYEIKDEMEAGLNCPNCLSDNTETYINTRDNHCLDCSFSWKILDSIDLE